MAAALPLSARAARAAVRCARDRAAIGRMRGRAAIDRMRGVVMVLMVLDHVGNAFDKDHFFANAAGWFVPGTPIAVDHFLARFVTHLCAPTFVFLAGASIALSLAKRGGGVGSAVGSGGAGVGRHLVLRGLVIAALEPLWVSPIWSQLETRGFLLLQVLYAIGLGLVLMVPLRRLPDLVLGLLALAILGFNEEIAIRLYDPEANAFPFWGGALFATYFGAAGDFDIVVAYPLLPWLAMMMLGWVWGRRLVVLRERGLSPVPGLLAAGAAALVLFAVLRGINAYGNHALLRESHWWIHWLHVSKYPPSITFTALTLGTMALGLAAFFVWERRFGAPSPRDPLVVFGRAALFFYVVHIPLITFAAVGSGEAREHGLRVTGWVSLAVCVVLYPLCLGYGRYKAAHPNGWTRFL